MGSRVLKFYTLDSGLLIKRAGVADDAAGRETSAEYLRSSALGSPLADGFSRANGVPI